ncbi:MAG: IPT/TIG domain-containing protein [bacterium]
MQRFVRHLLVAVCAAACAGAIGCIHIDRPDLLEVSPPEGQEGTEVTIVGTNFVDDFSQTRISFGGVVAPSSSVISIEPTEIHVRVPSGAVTGDVVVSVGGVESGRVPFRVIGPWLLVGTEASDGVTVFDTHTGLVQAVLPASGAPRAARFSPDGSLAWLLGDDEAGGFAWRFDSAASALDARVGLAPSPSALVFDTIVPTIDELASDRTEAWIGHLDGTIEVLESATPAVRATVDAGSRVSALEATTDGTVVVALAPDAPAVVFYDADSATPAELGRVDLGANPGPLIMNQLTSKAFVLERADARVAFVDPSTRTITERVAVGPDPIDMVLSGTTLFVLSRTNHTIDLVDGTGAFVIASIPVAGDATRLAVLVTASETLVWATTESNVLRGYDQLDKTEKKSLTVAPDVVAFRPLVGTTGQFLLLAHATDPGQLTIVDQPDTRARVTELPGTPTFLAVQP